MCDDVSANKSLFGNEHETPSTRSLVTRWSQALRAGPGLPRQSHTLPRGRLPLTPYPCPAAPAHQPPPGSRLPTSPARAGPARRNIEPAIAGSLGHRAGGIG
jgi:hypothetical protein